jgi:uncharacterized protein (TIGR03067 family)
MFRLALVALALASAAAVAAPVPKDLKKKEAKLDGTWEVVEYHSNGVKVNSAAAIKWVIDGQNLTIERNNPKGGIAVRPATVTYTLVKPDGGAANALDYTYNYTNGAIPSRAMPGVFELDGDSLKFCWTTNVNGERPAECAPAQGNFLYVFKRADSK